MDKNNENKNLNNENNENYNKNNNENDNNLNKENENKNNENNIKNNENKNNENNNKNNENKINEIKNNNNNENTLNSVRSIDLPEIQITRCLKCPFIPLMEINCDSKQTYIFSRCRNYHNYKKTLSEYLKSNEKNQFNLIFCSKCKKKYNNEIDNFFYCGKCKIFYCENCKEKNHIQINLHKFDSFCVEHDDKIISYCEICLKNLCIYCQNEHNKNHKILSLSNLLLNNKEIENYSNQLNKASNHLKKIEKICVEIIKKLNIKIEEIKNNFELFKNINNLQINFAKNILEILKQKNSKRELNYEIIMNVKNNFKFNYKDCEIFEYENIFQKAKKIENYLLNTSNFVLGNKDSFSEMKEIFTLTEHKKIINKIIIFDNENFLATCSKDNSINLYDIKKNYENIFKIVDHSQSVNYLCLLDVEDQRTLITSSDDFYAKIIKIFPEKNNYRVIQNLKHSKPVKKTIELNNKKIASCSGNKIYVYDFNLNMKKYVLNHILESNEFEIDSIFELPNFEIISASFLGKNLTFTTIKNKNNEEIINYDFISNVNCAKFPDVFCYLKEKIVACCAQNGIYLIDFQLHQIYKFVEIEKKENVWIENLIKLRDGTFLCNLSDYNKFNYKNFNVCQFDVVNFTNWNKIGEKNYVHNSFVTSLLQLNDGTIITAAKETKVWKYKDDSNLN